MAKLATREADTDLLLDFHKSRLETDLARWAALGRTDAEALRILNGSDGQGRGGANNPVSLAGE